MSNQSDLRQEITNRIIESWKSGNLPPWRQPWSESHQCRFTHKCDFQEAIQRRQSNAPQNPLLGMA